jgi:hypothetical protein
VKFALAGPFTLKAANVELTGTIDTDAKSIAFERQPPTPAPAKPAEPAPNPEAKQPDAPAKPAEAPKAPEPVKYAAERVDFDLDRVGFTLKGEAFGVDGLLRCTAVVTGDSVQGTAETSDGRTIPFTLTRREVPKPADAKPAEVAKAPAAKTIDPLAFIPRTTPLGEYGLDAPTAAQTVLVKNATIWTCGPAGKMEGADLLVQDGKVKEVGRNLKAPANALVIDATGKHVTPGLIDCHSHTGITGGVNEWTKNDTAECRIGDCIDPDAQGWFRELAGGLTVANQLHGSANPIGGQNSVVKLKWGGSAEDYRFPDAIGGIKFALGENVTRPRNRYPNTRMGVEALLRDSFHRNHPDEPLRPTTNRSLPCAHLSPSLIAHARACTPFTLLLQWNCYGAGVTAADLKTTADFLVSSGLRDAGYECAWPHLCVHNPAPHAFMPHILLLLPTAAPP